MLENICVCSNCFSHFLTTYCHALSPSWPQWATRPKPALGPESAAAYFMCVLYRFDPGLTESPHTFYHVSSLHVSIVSMLKHGRSPTLANYIKLHSLLYPWARSPRAETHLVGLPWSFLVAVAALRSDAQSKRDPRRGSLEFTAQPQVALDPDIHGHLQIL